MIILMKHVIITEREGTVHQEDFTHFPASLERVIACEARLGSSRNRPLIVPLSRRGRYVFSRFHVEDEQYVFRIQPGIHGIEPRETEDSFEALKRISKSAFYGQSAEGIIEPNVYISEEEQYFQSPPFFGVPSKLQNTKGDRYFLIIHQFNSSVEPRILRPIEASGYVPVAYKNDFEVSVLFPAGLHENYILRRRTFYDKEFPDINVTYRTSL